MPAETARKVWLPPPAVMARLADAAPRAMPPPPQSAARDRISIGPPSDRRARELVLRRDEDLTATPRGRRSDGGLERPARTATSTAAASAASTPVPIAASAGANRLNWPQQTGEARPPSSIAEYIKHWGDRHGAEGAAGVPSGTGQHIGPLFFDPEGADFTVWVNHFKNEVYRNWIVPQSVVMGLRTGQVEFEFTVDRSGRLVSVRTTASSGTEVLDRAAQNALLSSQLLPLPSDYAPPTVTMRARFLY